MFKNNVYSFKAFPVEQRQRHWTDCCCTIIGAIFALTLFIVACFSYTRYNFYQVNFPVDRTETTCSLQQPDAPFIYFQNPNQLTHHQYCVQDCPSNGETLSCSKDHPCPNVRSNYKTRAVVNRLGGFCEPTDQQLKEKFWKNDAFRQKFDLVGAYDAIEWSLLIALGVGLLYLLAVVFLPRMMTWAVFILAFLLVLVGAILLLIQPIKLLDYSSNTSNIILGIVFIVMAILILVFFFCYRQQIELASIFMFYSNVFLKQNPAVFLYIILYIVLSFGLVVLCIWQYIALGTISEPQYNKGDLYYHSKQNVFWQVLNAIQFIWGIQFLRDSGNYLVSGNAVQWYFNYRNNSGSKCTRPLVRFLCKNWGSVGGGSFINAFLHIFDIFFDLFRCDHKGRCGKCYKCCHTVCCCCTSIFDLCRSDAYAYIHLSGIPYCNAARQMEALCERSHLFTSDYTCVRLYRMAGQIFCVVLATLLSFIVLKAQVDYANWYIVGLLICTCYLIVTHFVDLHPNGAEGIFTCYLAEDNCEGDGMMDVCPDALRAEVHAFETKYDLLPE